MLAPSPGRYTARGFSAFAPGCVGSVENVRILTTGATCEEVPSIIRAAASWFDDSVKLVEIVFAVEADQQGAAYFWVEWGPEVRRTDLPRPTTDDPSRALYFEEAEVPSPEFDLSAGTLVVRVARHPDLWYYAYLIPAAAIMAVLLWRKVKLGK